MMTWLAVTGMLLTQSACGQNAATTVTASGCVADKPAAIAGYAKRNLKQYEGKVLRVSDGDTIQVVDGNGQKHKIRLAFIDAPELQQAAGKDSQKRLQQLLGGKTVTVQMTDIDQYKREVAIVWQGTQDVNAVQLADGWAWHYESIAKRQQTDHGYAYYRCLQQSAQSGRAGLWRNAKAQAPWQYRKQQHNG